MMRKKQLLALSLSCLLVGCSNIDTKMTASTDLNPDINGYPSPLAVSVFELSDPSTFERAGFVNLYTNPQRALGSSLLSQKSLMLVPGTETTVSLPLLQNAHFIGYVAAYRNFNAVTWQAIVPIPNQGILGATVEIKLNNQGIQVINQQEQT